MSLSGVPLALNTVFRPLGRPISDVAAQVAGNPGAYRHLSGRALDKLVGSGDSFYYSDQRIALANSVRPDMSLNEMLAVNQLDRQLAIRAEQRKIIEEIEYLRMQARDEQKRRRRAQSQGLFDAGAVFGT